ncbi:MAG: copper chaperone Copz family protein [Anaerolineae bacterium]
MSELECCGVSEAGASTCEVPGSRPTPAASACPSCGQKGKAVDGQTVKALLAISLAHVTHEPYLFCRTPDCAVVYFSADGEQVFTTDQVREGVYQKEPDAPDVLVCYCFRHTRGSIQAEIETTGQSTVVEAINAGIQAGQCACDIRNPQGSCCLGNVHALVRHSISRVSDPIE